MEAVEQMRRRGRPEYELAELFMDFKGIQVTLAVMAQALIDGRIDCKTAGRLAVELQTASKLLWIYHRGRRGTQRQKALTTKDTKEHKERKTLPLIHTDDTDLKKQPTRAGMSAGSNRTVNEQQKTRIVSVTEVRRLPDSHYPSHGPPEWAKAA
jgi:hypothetical protein